jgi:hypothetical protein
MGSASKKKPKHEEITPPTDKANPERRKSPARRLPPATPTETIRKARPDTPVPPPTRVVVETRPTASGSETTIQEVIRMRPLVEYRFGIAFTMAEYLGETLVDRLRQAKWYGDIAINFVGTRENFEHVPGSKKLPKKTTDDRRNADVISSLWRVRLLSCGTASDAVMMICHPLWYAEVMAANQTQPDERLSIPDQIKGMRAFNIMLGEVNPKHGAVGASPSLPPIQAWEEMQGRPGRGLLMPNGSVLPEAVAKQMAQFTGIVVLHDGILDKLRKVAELKTGIDELMSAIAQENQPPVRSRLGPHPAEVGGEGTAGNKTIPSQVRLPGPPEAGERQKKDHPQPQPTTSITPPETPTTTPTPPGGPATTSTHVDNDLEDAGKDVKNVEFDDGQDDTRDEEAEDADEESDQECKIIEQCQPMVKKEVKSSHTEDPKDREEDLDLLEDELVMDLELQGEAVIGEYMLTAAEIAVKDEKINVVVEEAAVMGPANKGPEASNELPSPPVRGQSQIRINPFRVAGMSPSEGSSTNTEDELFQGAATKRTSGNISPQDLDPDNVLGSGLGGRIKWSKPSRKRKKRKNTSKSPYTGIPYVQPEDDVAEDFGDEEEEMEITEAEEVGGVGTAGNQEIASQVRLPGPYKQLEDDIQDTVVNAPRLDLVGCPEFIEGHLSYAAPLPFITPKRTCREPVCLARQSWFEYTDYDDIEHHYYDTKTREQATRDSTMLQGTTYDLTVEARTTRKIYVYGSSGAKTNNVTTNWLRLRNALISVGFFKSIAGTSQVSVDLEGFTTRALESYVKSGNLDKSVWKNAFTVLHMAAPNGVIVQVRVIWDGQEARGQRIPFELTEILKDVRIRKIGFGLDKDAVKLASVGIKMESVCDMANIVLMAWPQMEAREPKTGKMFVSKMLQSPCPLYAKSKDKPEHVKPIRIDYEVMDFTKAVDKWHWHWSYYNAMDHYLAFALLDFLSARAADLDNLNMEADVVRYQLALLDAIRDLPNTGIIRRQDMSFAIGKNETDEDRDLIRPWPIIKDFPIYNSLRSRRQYTDGLLMKHKLDLSHYSEGYLKYMEAEMESPMQEWDGWCKHGHSNWFNYVGKRFPHGCGSCGSFDHARERCDSTANCEYPYCRGLDHEMRVCPIIAFRCGTCGGLGHTEHNTDSTVTLAENFNAAKHIHMLASRLSNKRLAYKVQRNVETEALEVVETQSPYARKLVEEKAPK